MIPDDKTTVTAFSVIENELKDQLRVIVQEPIDDADIQPFKNVRRLYAACMNTSLIENQSATPVRNVINNMGGWPVLETNWNGNDWTWQRSVQLSRTYGYSVSNFISFSVSTDNKNSSRRIIRVRKLLKYQKKNHLLIEH